MKTFTDRFKREIAVAFKDGKSVATIARRLKIPRKQVEDMLRAFMLLPFQR